MKDSIYVPSLPTTLEELTERIERTVELITPDMLTRVWDAFGYRCDLITVEGGGTY